MAQHEHMSIQKNTASSMEEHDELSGQTAAKVAMALSALDSRYKENIADYAQELHSWTHRIDSARIELEMLFKQKEPYDDTLTAVEKEIEYTLRLLQRLTDQYIQKTVVVSELEDELKNLGHSKESESLLQNRYTELDRLEAEIGNLELTLLNHELEKQNLLLKTEPITRKISSLEQKIRELESKKRYIESAYLHRITQVASIQPSKLPPAAI
ncbi:hypothetical protein YH65_03805 [Sulfurovum lithotrophicum]|uniref:Uncharacterized protein n=1 Tax=Sulfurovum lithotrophicum TaxID=206403 RepID=A0A7U4M0K8_9BACT|nr:hypothetical protein [Sulfurovum lithotrophicum]AKF24609.1 hypothetical protein YH65_03805 [Sulfurovum lithotrophicum]